MDSMRSKGFTSKVIEGYDDPSARPIENIFRLLMRANGSLVMIGDSVHEQFAQAMTCQAERENLKGYDWKNGWETDIGAIVDGKVAPYHFLKSFYLNEPQMKADLLQLIPNYDFVMVLFNTGLHYNNNSANDHDAKHYKRVMVEFFEFLSSLKFRFEHKKFVYVWKEATAQHFQTSNGYYAGRGELNMDEGDCVEIRDKSMQNDWRNYIVHDLLDSQVIFNGSNEDFFVLPMLNWTKDLWPFHVNLMTCGRFM